MCHGVLDCHSGGPRFSESMVKTYKSRFPPSSNLSKVIISVDKFD